MAIFGEPMLEPAIPFESVRAVLTRYAERHPEKTALYDLDQEKRITYGQLDDVTRAIARYLNNIGIKKGDRIALLSDENIEKLIIWMGIGRYGSVVCPLNVEMNQAYLTDLLNHLGPRLVIWNEGLDGPSFTGNLTCQTVMFSKWPADTERSADEFFRAIAAYRSGAEADQSNTAEDVACIFCTSGTTAKPKCVVYNHLAYWLNGLSTIDMVGLSAEDRTLEYRSFGWNSAQILSLMPWLETGLSLHIAKKFSHSRFFQWIKEHGITFAAGVPTVINILLNEPLGVTAKDVPTLRLMTCSTAPLSPEQWRKFEERYGVKLLQLYGMSEAGWICGNRHYQRRMGTVGLPALHQQFLITDAEGKACPPGTEGEVTVGGPQTCLGTISPDGVYEDLSGRRIKSGDLAIMDEEGFVRVTGRTKDLIIRGGINIAPLEIDHVLLGHPKVAEVATIGAPDEIYGEEIVCFVVPRPGEAVTAEELSEHCSKTLPPFKMPKRFAFVATLPKSDRGKLRRDELKKMWMQSKPAF